MPTADLFPKQFKKGDQVQIIAGRDKGKVGKIIAVSLSASTVRVEKVNLLKRHLKPAQGRKESGIVEREGAIHVSNVALYCVKCGKGVRCGSRLLSDAKGKERYCKRCNESLGQTAKARKLK